MQLGPVFFHVSRLRLSTVMAAAVALVAACGTAQAAVITYDFAGTLDSVPTATELSQFTLGEAFSGSWTVDDSVGPHMPLVDPGFPGAFNQFDANDRVLRGLLNGPDQRLWFAKGEVRKYRRSQELHGSYYRTIWTDASQRQRLY